MSEKIKCPECNMSTANVIAISDLKRVETEDRRTLYLYWLEIRVCLTCGHQWAEVNQNY